MRLKINFILSYLPVNGLAPLESHDDVIKWNHFPRYWPTVRGIHRSPVDSPYKDQFWCFLRSDLNKRLSKQSRPRLFETPSRSLWLQSDHLIILPTVILIFYHHSHYHTSSSLLSPVSSSHHCHAIIMSLNSNLELFTIAAMIMCITYAC